MGEATGAVQSRSPGPPQADLELVAVGHLIGGRYRVDAPLARGGMGMVYRAIDTSTGQLVAVKRLHPQTVGHAGAVLLFQREYHTLARLKHPRIVRAYDYGVDEAPSHETLQGIPFYVMELLDGQDLKQLAPLDPQRACRYLRDVASALALIHAQRLVHRDLTPRNVRITEGGHAKLIDFGALTSFGVAPQIVGTPPFVPPEALRNLPLDPRADLFALGALAYWVLTGQHAYPARRLDELPEVWRALPPPPSHYAPDISPELDSLVMTLLNQQAVARPSSAGEVIEWLTRVGRLPTDQDLEAASSYLTSTPIIGRERELTRLKRRMQDLVESQRKSTVVITGAPGTGKTRLLSELALEAQVLGATVLHVEPPAFPRPYALAQALFRAALQVTGPEAEPLLRTHIPILGHVMPELHTLLGKQPLARLSREPTERRQQAQAAVGAVLSALAEALPLLVFIDRMEAADEPSAAALAVLAQQPETRWMLVASAGEHDDTPARAPLAALHKSALRVVLQPFDLSQAQALVGALFDDVPHVGRLAKSLHEASGGYPAVCLQLAERLVARGTVTYQHGVWVLPHELPADALPTSHEASLGGRLEKISADARQVGEILSLLERPVNANLCAALLEGTIDDPGGALEALIEAGVLTATEEGYTFLDPRWRALLRERFPADSQAHWHARIADQLQVLAGADPDPFTLLEIGWHHLHGGAEPIGADLLVTAGERLLTKGIDLPRSAQALEAALAVYERHKASPYLRASVMSNLARIAIYVGPELADRYGMRAMRLLLELSGLRRAQRLSRWLPNFLAVGFGMLGALIDGRRRKRQGLVTLPVRELVSRLLSVAGSAMGVAATVVDPARCQTILDVLRPLQLFNSRHACRLVYEYCKGLTLMMHGRTGEGEAHLRRFMTRLDMPGAYPAIVGWTRASLRTGVRYLIGVMNAFAVGDRTLQLATEIRSIDSPLSTLWADQLGLYYHALRGEHRLAQEYRERVEQQALAGGSTWQVDINLPSVMVTAAFITDDLLLARRSVEALEQLRQAHPHLDTYRHVAKAELLYSRGAIEEAAQLLGEHLPRPWSLPGWCSAAGAYAGMLNSLGRHQEAKQLCERLAGELSETDLEFPLLFASPTLELAMAEAGLGQLTHARELLDELLAIHGDCPNPAFRGHLHRYRARLAMLMDDAEAFAFHLQLMRAAYFETENPILLRHADNLEKQAQRQGLAERLDAGPRGRAIDPVTAVEQSLSTCTDLATTAQTSLRLLLELAGTNQGHLFVRQNDGLQLYASEGEAPPPGLAGHLAERLLAIGADEMDTDSQEATEEIPSQPFEAGPGTGLEIWSEGTQRYGLANLLVSHAGQLITVGAVALGHGPQLKAPPIHVLTTVAAHLFSGLTEEDAN